jgi:SAM-dependent methyltransferase
MNRRERARHNIEARVYRDAIGASPESKWKIIVPLLTEYGYASRVLRKRLGLSTPLNTEDRRVLEEMIFPYYRADPSFETVLFVGCNTYTSHYQQQYFAHKKFWTIEPDASLEKFGADRHVVAPLEEVGRHFADRSLDLIICNGVFGWGLDAAAQCEAAFAQCHACLRDGGHLVFGWDDVPRRTPVSLAEIRSLAQFHRFTFPPLRNWRYLTETPYRHTFDFYRK